MSSDFKPRGLALIPLTGSYNTQKEEGVNYVNDTSKFFLT